ncbi:MAG TPA: hypothetical protein VK157_00960 [Phycisphaerales bacterium]|nr:hypothetical protein [Phycisphaerales bacterium]
MSQFPPPVPPNPPSSFNSTAAPSAVLGDSSSGEFVLPEKPQTQLVGAGIVTDAWRLMAANYGLLLGVVGVWAGIAIASAVVSLALEQMHPALSSSWDVLTLFLVDIPLLAGVVMVGVRLARGERPAFDAMFDGFRAYGPVVLIGFIRQMIIVAGMFIALIPVLSIALLTGFSSGRGPVGLLLVGMIFGFVLAVGVYLFLATRLFFADVMYLDQTGPRPRPMDAIRLSWRITGPVTLTLVLLGLLASLIALGTALMLIIGLFLLGGPLLIAMSGITVRRMLESLDRPVCNHCGFDTSASTQPRCAECGRTPWRYTRVGV